ncbi:MAG: FeoA domain-containing protein [Deltaproteobacteria bacterium]|nr:FeoA domain-containing protein [Deltaproteobacteria bacterium]MBW2659464.1 FeoA domain-containing protein [Deltaproteobacteria bacterium]
MTITQHMPVSALQTESECIIRSLGSNEKTAQRLAQMGILPGTHLRIIRVAPLGGTIEVTGDQGQSFALRQQEVAAMTCEPVAMPLVSELVTVGQTYKVRTLLGGKTFRKRMENKELLEGRRIKLQKNNSMRILIDLIDRDSQIELGQGEAKKIIIEVISHESGE